MGRKAGNVFLQIGTRISENFDIKHLRWRKADLSKESKKKKILRKDTVRNSEAVVRRYSIRKLSLKILPPV